MGEAFVDCCKDHGENELEPSSSLSSHLKLTSRLGIRFLLGHQLS
jgi:hypothetical protein